jgi:hypothetical protein
VDERQLAAAKYLVDVNRSGSEESTEMLRYLVDDVGLTPESVMAAEEIDEV